MTKLPKTKLKRLQSVKLSPLLSLSQGPSQELFPQALSSLTCQLLKPMSLKLMQLSVVVFCFFLTSSLNIFEYF